MLLFGLFSRLSTQVTAKAVIDHAVVMQYSGVCVLILSRAQHTDNSTFGVPVELGAQFIHGTQTSTGAKNPVHTLAVAQGWATVAFGGSGTVSIALECSSAGARGVLGAFNSLFLWFCYIFSRRGVGG